MSKILKVKLNKIFASKFRLFLFVFTVVVLFSASCAGLYVYVKSQITHETPAIKEETTQVTTAPTPAPTTPKPIKKPTPKPIVTKKKVTKVVVAKVVKPAPTSSVDGLTTTTTTDEPTTPTTPPPTPTAPIRTSTISYSSTNWSGYLATGGSFTSVSGSWTAPNVTGVDGIESADGSWIGIGGVTSGDLIQVGTANSVSSTGEVTTYAFYELLPAAAQIIPSLTVHPGDSMSASIIETSTNQWSIVINNVTTGKSFSIAVSYASTHSSAEWIQEAPSYVSGGLVPLDYFGTVYFSNCASSVDGYSYTLDNIGASSVTMVTSGGTPIAVPSSISGSSFSVTRR